MKAKVAECASANKPQQQKFSLVKNFCDPDEEWCNLDTQGQRANHFSNAEQVFLIS